MLACFYQCTLFFSVSSCPSLFWYVDFRFFSCVLRKREIRGGTDLRRTRADHVRLTKSRECFRSVVSRYHETFQRHLPLTIQFYTSCRISGVPPLQSDFSGLSSALKDDTNEPKKRKEARTKPTKMARKKSTLRMTRTTTDKLPTCDFYYNLARRLPAPSPGPALLSAAAGASVYLEPVHL